MLRCKDCLEQVINVSPPEPPKSKYQIHRPQAGQMIHFGPGNQTFEFLADCAIVKAAYYFGDPLPFYEDLSGR